jgi:hypothetical protein
MTRGYYVVLHLVVLRSRFVAAMVGACLLCLPALAVNGTRDAHTLRTIAFTHYLEKDLDSAFEYYQQAVDVASKEYGRDSTYVGDLYYEMGTIALNKKRFNSAENYLREAVKQNPNSIMAHVKLAELLELRARPDLALEQIQKALAKDSKSPEARHALVLWLVEQKNSAAAVREAYTLERSSTIGVSHPEESEPKLATITPAQIEKPAESAEKTEKPEEKPPEAKPTGVQTVFNVLFQHPASKPAVAPAPKPAVKAAPKPSPIAVVRQRPPRHKEQPQPPRTKPAHKAPQEPVVVETKETKELKATQGVLKTTAELKKEKPKQEQRTENETREQPQPQVTSSAAPVRMEPVLVPVPGKKHGSKLGLVPPPPPTPIFAPPPVAVQQPPPQPAPKPVVKKEKPKEPPASEEKPAAAPSASSQDDDFFLKWADVKGKKKP